MPEVPNGNIFVTDVRLPMSYKQMLSSSVPTTGTPPIYVDSNEPGIIDLACLNIVEAQFRSFKGKKSHVVYSAFQEIEYGHRWDYSFGELDYPEEVGSHRRFARVMVEELASGLSMAQLVYARNDIENGLKSEFRIIGENRSPLVAAAQYRGNELDTIAAYVLPTALFADNVFVANMEEGIDHDKLNAKLQNALGQTKYQIVLATRQRGNFYTVVMPKHTDEARTNKMYNFLFSGTEFLEDAINFVTPDSLGFEMHLSTKSIG